MDLLNNSHLYKRFPGKKIGEAASIFSEQYSSDGEKRPGVAVLAVVLSIHSNFTKIVEPRIEAVKERDIYSLADLEKHLGSFDDFVKLCDLKSVSKFDILKRLIEAVKQLKKKYAIDDDYQVLNNWATHANYRDRERDVIGQIRGIGLATFQHLRMNFGANTVKPDQRVKDVLKREFEINPVDTEAIEIVEYIAQVIGKSTLYVDQLFVNYGSGYYSKDNTVRLKYNRIDEKKIAGNNSTNRGCKINNKQYGTIPSDYLYEEIKSYFYTKKFFQYIEEFTPKNEPRRDRAHFFRLKRISDAREVIYISASGNICISKKTAVGIHLKENIDYTMKGYRNHQFQAVITNNSLYYNNIKLLLDKIINFFC